MTGPEHYREAEAALRLSDDYAPGSDGGAALLACAQAHATLALAAATVDARRGGTHVWESWPTTPPPDPNPADPWAKP